MAAKRTIMVSLLFCAAVAMQGCGEKQESSAAKAPTELQVQTARSGSFVKSNGLVALRLEDVSPVTVTFADRPNRDVGALPTGQFSDQFASNFSNDPPNATLTSIKHGDFVIELLASGYDQKSRTLEYSIRPLNTSIKQLPDELGAVSLFIDPDTEAPPETIHGTVTDTEGNPVSGATIEILTPLEGTYGDSMTTHLTYNAPVEIGEVTTGADGAFSDTDVYSQGETLGFKITADDFVPFAEDATLAGSDDLTANFTIERISDDQLPCLPGKCPN